MLLSQNIFPRTFLENILYLLVLIFAMKKKYQGKDIKASENETKAVNEANSGLLINDAKVDHETHI